MNELINYQSKKQQIFNAFSKMDIGQLQILLDDNKTYQDATKETFLEKLQEIFIQFKKHEDTELFQCYGRCRSKECPNRGKSGYAFVGNKSNLYMKLIFEETESDILDIYHCTEFSIPKQTLKLKKYSSLDIKIKKDEEATFKPSVNYSIKLQQCDSAIDELYNMVGDNLTRDVAIYWLEKHNELYHSMLPPALSDYMAFNSFKYLYYHLKDLEEHQQFDEISVKANKEFYNFSINNQLLLLKWITKYRDHFNEAYSLCPYFIYDDGMMKGYDHRVKKILNSVSVYDYIPTIIFLHNFDNHCFTCS